MTASAVGQMIPESDADVAVIGGGIHGCSAALHLARRGCQVILIERDGLGHHASGVNAGGVRLLGRDLAEIALAVAALKEWHCIVELLGDDCGFRPIGHVQVAETAADVAAQEVRLAALERAGFATERWVSAAALRQILPGIAAHCRGGLVSKGDGDADPFRTIMAYRAALSAAGVRVVEGQAVQVLEREVAGWLLALDNGRATRAGSVVNCAGAWGGEIAAALGDHAPVEAVAPMMLVTARVRGFLDRVIIAQGRPFSLKQAANGALLIGGGRLGRINQSARRAEVDLVELRQSARAFTELFPAMGQVQAVRSWAGVEGRTVDGLPVIGPGIRAPGVVHAFGFSLHGFALGPVVGHIVAELVCDGCSRFDLTAFRIDRFARGPGSDSEQRAAIHSLHA